MGTIEITLDVEDVTADQTKAILGKVQDFITANTSVKLRYFNFAE